MHNGCGTAEQACSIQHNHASNHCMCSLLSVFARLLHLSSSSRAGKRHDVTVIAIFKCIYWYVYVIVLPCMFAGALADSLQKWR